MQLIKVNRERRNPPDVPDPAGINAVSSMHLSKKPCHWIQEIICAGGAIIIPAKPAGSQRRIADEQKCA
jgi:hypothetical protein